MSIKDELQQFRKIEYLSDRTSSTLHEAGTITVQNWLSIEQFFRSGVLEGGIPDSTAHFDNKATISRMVFSAPIRGFLNGRRIYIDSTDVYHSGSGNIVTWKPDHENMPGGVGLGDGTSWIYITEDPVKSRSTNKGILQESSSPPDFTTGLILCAVKMRSGQIVEFSDERILIPEMLNQFKENDWKGYYPSTTDVPTAGWKNGDVILVGQFLYIWNDNYNEDSPWIPGTHFHHWHLPWFYTASKTFNRWTTYQDKESILADTTADTLTLKEGTSIRFWVDSTVVHSGPDTGRIWLDDATIKLFVDDDLNMNDYQIRRSKITDVTGDVKVSGDFIVHGNVDIDDLVLDQLQIEEVKLAPGRDSTVWLRVRQYSDSTFTSGDIYTRKTDVTTTNMIIGAITDVTGDILIDGGTLNGVFVEDHSYRHEHPSGADHIDGGLDQIDLTGMFGALKDKQNAVQLQGEDVRDQAPKEGSWLEYDGTEWVPKDTTEVGWLDSMAIINWGLGKPSRFRQLERQVNDELIFDSTEIWESMSLSVVFSSVYEPGDSGLFHGGTFDGKYVYMAPDMIENAYVRWDPHGPWPIKDHIINEPGESKPFKIFKGIGKDGGGVAGLSNRKLGCCFDGRYIYYAPNMFSDLTPEYVSRFDTKFSNCEFGRSHLQFGFKDSSAWETTEIEGDCSGIMFDGRWVYYTGENGEDWFKRYDIKMSFGSSNAWEEAEKEKRGIHGETNTNYYKPGFDGKRVYFYPDADTTMLRFKSVFCDRHAGLHFNDTTCWERLHCSWLGMGPSGKANGSAFDGRYLYFSPDAGDVEGAASQYSEFIATDGDDCDVNEFTGVITILNNNYAFFGGTYHSAGLRFTNLTIPQGTSVQSAYLYIYTDSIAGTITDETAKIYGDDVDDAAAWSTYVEFQGRTKTTANTDIGGASKKSGTGWVYWDVTDIVNEILARGGWVNGNDMAFLLDSQSNSYGYYRFYQRFYTASKCPKLIIDYSADQSYYGQFARYDTTDPWDSENAWEYIPFTAVFQNPGGEYEGDIYFWGATFDGRFIYYAPYNSNSFVRFDTKESFYSASIEEGYGPPLGWKVMNCERVMRDVPASGKFCGCIFDGFYINFIPYYSYSLVRCKAFPSGGMFSRWGE